MAPKRERSCKDALRLKRPRWKLGVLRLPDGCSRVAPERLAEALRSLGVGKAASVEEIRKGYRRQALLSHPDRGGSADHFRSLVAALEIALAARSGSEAAVLQEEQAAGRLQRQARAVALKAALTDVPPATLEARLAALQDRELEELEELLAASALVPTEANRRRSLGQRVGTSQDQLRGISRVVRRGVVQYQVRTTLPAPSSSLGEEVLKLTSSPSADLSDAVDALAAIEQAKADAARMLLSGAGVEEAAATLAATGVQLTFQWRFILEEGSHTLYAVSDLPTSLDHRRRFREALESRDALVMRRLKERFRGEVAAARAFHAAQPGRLLQAVRDLRLASEAIIVEQPPQKRPRVAVDDVDLDRKRLRAKEEEAFEAAMSVTLQGLVDSWVAEEQTLVESVPATPASQPTQLWGWSPPILVDDEAPSQALEADPQDEAPVTVASPAPPTPPPAVAPIPAASLAPTAAARGAVAATPTARWRNMLRVGAVVTALAVMLNG